MLDHATIAIFSDLGALSKDDFEIQNEGNNSYKPNVAKKSQSKSLGLSVSGR